MAVIGAGGVGLNAIQGAALAGAARIVAVDVSAEKLAAAREFGATDGVAAGPAPPRRSAELTGGRGVDFAFVAVGAPAAIGEAAGLSRGRRGAGGRRHAADGAAWSATTRRRWRR